MSDTRASRPTFDFIVIGAGIAGASVAAELAQSARVALIEMERQPGMHTTGRSAAIFAPTYGPAAIRALTRASEGFYLAPPEDFATAPLLSARQTMMIAREDQIDSLNAFVAEVGTETDIRVLEHHELMREQPLLRESYVSAAVLDPSGSDIDVNGLHQGYLRMFRACGGVLHTNAPVSGLLPNSAGWRVDIPGDNLQAKVVVNAAGAWADQIGALAGAGQIGLIPKRRTALIVAAPEGRNRPDAPLTVDIDEQFYLKPESGRLLISPADETPSAPCDAQPEELDVAICIDRIQRAFDLDIRRIQTKWAGLRSFVADKSPVAGFSQFAEGFFWLAGQGGYGIQTAPALARLAASMAAKRSVPTDILAEGLSLEDLAPARVERPLEDAR